MNARAQITMDLQMQRRAQAKAAELGISFAEYVRRLVANDLGGPKKRPDISIFFDLGASGEPTNIARDKDKMIGEAVWEEHLRSLGRKPRRPATAARSSSVQAALTTFVDTSVWFAAGNLRDSDHDRAKVVLRGVSGPVLTDHVLVETWRLLRIRVDKHAADEFWLGVRRGGAALEFVTAADLETAWVIGEAFSDQGFSIVDRTSFAVMERLGITRAASFDDHFAVYRYGRRRDRAFEVLR
jgi:predicted nucleic acid-binding protein